jgi:hypothetical protein
VLLGVPGDCDISLSRCEYVTGVIVSDFSFCAQSVSEFERNISLQSPLESTDSLQSRRGVLIFAGTPLVTLCQPA